MIMILYILLSILVFISCFDNPVLIILISPDYAEIFGSSVSALLDSYLYEVPKDSV